MIDNPIDDPNNNITMTIVKFCILLVIGLVILSSISTSGMLSTSSSVTLTFNQQPNDGDTVQFDGHIYEFDSNGLVVSGHIPVTIGYTLDVTSQNFKTAVSNNYGVV